VPASKSLVRDDQTVRLPEEDLGAIASAIEKQEEMSRKRILTEKVTHHSHDTVEALSHVGGPRAKKDTDSGGELREHELAPSREPYARANGQAVAATSRRAVVCFDVPSTSGPMGGDERQDQDDTTKSRWMSGPCVLRAEDPADP
jgi:hypothetical protein